MRVLLRKTVLVCDLSSECELTPVELGLLCASVKAWRRAGTGRNRGRGRLEATILDLDKDRRDVLVDGLAHFSAHVQGEAE